jgi:hypothetical protein
MGRVMPGRRASRLFLLSPANAAGVRARQLLSPRAAFDLARRVQSAQGAPMGEVFAFVSGLYFRGKLAYAMRFADMADHPARAELGGGVLVITPGAGLRSADTHVNAEALRLFAQIDIDLANPAYYTPLVASARHVARAIGAEGDVVLLGSIATPKYVDLLLGIFGPRLLFPPAFVGRGDMSRGGLLLRHARAGVELEYAPVQGAVRHGERPPRLGPLMKQ